MNKSILMKFAIESRNTLMKSIDTTLMAMGFTASTIPASRQSGDKVFVNEKEYSRISKKWFPFFNLCLFIDTRF